MRDLHPIPGLVGTSREAHYGTYEDAASGPACLSLITPTLPHGLKAPLRIQRPSERRSLSRSATRALDLLECFGAERRPLRAVEISRMLDMHPSTTNQLLKTMVDSAHLVFDARTKCYLPSPRLDQFAGWIVETHRAGHRLRGLLCDIQARTGMVVTVSAPNDLFMQVIDLVYPEGQASERGLRVSQFGTAIGSAFLSMLDEAEIARLSIRARVPKHELPDVLAAAADIRRKGYADGPTGASEIWSIALPLPCEELSPPTVLGLAGPNETVRERLDDLVAIMREEIARHLG
jgi:DNA-binding IclR family transcriptional regulator